MNRPASVVAVLVVVLLHALLLVGRTVASALSLVVYTLTHPGVLWGPAELVTTASGTLLSLVLAAADLLLVVWLWRGANRARVLLTVLVVVSGVLALGGAVVRVVALSGASAVPVALSTVELILFVTAAVLLWRPSTSAWLQGWSVGGWSVGPAGPGL